MEALTLDDLLPLEEFAARRREFFTAQQRYIDRYRRVRIGPDLTLIFENRQTLWFKVQEILRVTRLAEPNRVKQALDLYNRLLPGKDRLQAALVIAVRDETRLAELLAPWERLGGDQLALHVGPLRCPANLLTCRPEDRAVGASHWVQFVLDAEEQALLADPRWPAHFVVSVPGHAHDSGPLDEELRKSLLDDLK